MSNSATLGLFNAPNIEECLNTLVQHCPQGIAWDTANPDSNIRNFLYGPAKIMQVLQEQIQYVAEEFQIKRTYDLLEDWELSVGLPSTCILTDGDIETRRNQVIRRLRKIPIVTLAQLQSYINALFPDTTVNLYPMSDYANYEYTYGESGFRYIGELAYRFILVVEVPYLDEYEYDYSFDYYGGPDVSKIECALREVIPASCALYFVYISTGA